MPRRQKINIKLGDKESLQSMLEDIHHDTMTFRNQVIRELSIISNSAELADDHSIFQIAKAKTNLLSLLNNNTSNKVLLSKMLASLMDSYEIEKENESRVSLKDFSAIRQMLKDQDKKKD